MSKNVKLGGTSLRGLDVSHYQGKIDFQKIKDEGYSFVICKASDGLGFDSTYKANAEAARAVGLVVGAYHFFRFNIDTLAQMDVLITAVGQHRVGDLPPTIDIEWSEGYKTMTSDTSRESMLALKYLKSKLGVTPIIYTSAGFFVDEDDFTEWNQFYLWIASYRTDFAIIPSCWDKFTFWQQTDKRISQGIVDGDVFNGNMADLMAMTGFNVHDPFVQPSTRPQPLFHIKTTAVIVDPTPKPEPAPELGFFAKLWVNISSIFWKFL